MGTPAQRPIAVFRVNPAAFWVTLLAAPVLQAFLPLRLPLAGHFDFPLLATIYFALARRNKVFGIFLGTMMGLLEDGLSHSYFGIYGMSKALVGYLAASASIKFDLEPVAARLSLAGILVLSHNLFLAGLEHGLLESPPPFQSLDLLISVLVNVALGSILFLVLDRFKQPA